MRLLLVTCPYREGMSHISDPTEFYTASHHSYGLHMRSIDFDRPPAPRAVSKDRFSIWKRFREVAPDVV